MCVLLACFLTSIESALQSFSKSRAEAHVKDGKRGAERLLQIMQDPAPYLNTALFLRLLTEISAILHPEAYPNYRLRYFTELPNTEPPPVKEQS